MSVMRIAMASPTSAPATATGRVTSWPPRIAGVIIGPQHPGAVFATICLPSLTGPSIGSAGSSNPFVNSLTNSVSAPASTFSIRSLAIRFAESVFVTITICSSRGMALGLLRAGANVVITAARTLKEIETVENEGAKIRDAGALRKFVADVTRDEDCRLVVSETIREFGAVHILVNNAGRGMRFVSEKFFDTPTKFWQTDPALWRMIVDTNVNGPFLMAREVAPPMINPGSGRTINIS